MMFQSVESIVEMYVVQKMTTTQIAVLLDCCNVTIGNILKKHGVTMRFGRDAQLSIVIPKQILQNLYVDAGLTLSEVGVKVGASEECVRRLLIKYDIPRRSRTHHCAGNNKGVSMTDEQRAKLSKTRKALYASGVLQHWNKGNHWDAAIREKISKSLLKGRRPAESSYGQDWRFQRSSCLQRDSFTCQQCGKITDLEVHHWEPYRFCFDNSLDNLVTLCERCHRFTHNTYRLEGFIAEVEETMYARS